MAAEISALAIEIKKTCRSRFKATDYPDYILRGGAGLALLHLASLCTLQVFRVLQKYSHSLCFGTDDNALLFQCLSTGSIWRVTPPDIMDSAS